LTAPTPLSPPLAQALDADGYLILRAPMSAEVLAGAQAAFDQGVMPSEQWPVPRGHDWRHALVDLDPAIRSICRLPGLIAAAAHLIRRPFFLTQVEGREPLPGGGSQALHRDGGDVAEPEIVSALAFLDDFGPDNGATRLIPGSHGARLTPLTYEDDARAITVTGQAGDILVFDANLAHGGTTNHSGARRRSLLINYFAVDLVEVHRATVASRNVRMAEVEVFGAPALASAGAIGQ